MKKVSYYDGIFIIKNSYKGYGGIIDSETVKVDIEDIKPILIELGWKPPKKKEQAK